MFGRFGTGELLIILLIVLLIFGASRIPQIARSLGQGIKEFRKVGREIKEDKENDLTESEEKKKNP